MNTKKAIKKLASLNVSYLGNEEVHHKADNILLKFLKSKGYGKVAQAYKEARTRTRFAYS
jgi:hypothetical protein